MTKRKRINSIIAILSIIALYYLASFDSFSESNLSRIANKSLNNYLLAIIVTLLYGYSISITIDSNKILALLSLLVGIIVPYDYLKPGTINSTLHLLLAFSSIVICLLIVLISIIKLNKCNVNIARKLTYLLIIVSIICLYLYAKYGFMNSLNELLYLTYVMFNQYIIYIRR